MTAGSNQGDNRTPVSQVTADKLESHNSWDAGASLGLGVRFSLGTSFAGVPDWGGAPFSCTELYFGGWFFLCVSAHAKGRSKSCM